jgi:hypothetical protein
MTSERKRKIAKGIAVLVGIVGMMVIIGWIFDVGVLKSLSPSWISMKFNTAIAFVLSGLMLYLIVQNREGESDAAQVILPIASLVILLLMGTLFFSDLFGVHTGAEELFIQDVSSASTMVTPGGPSLMTMFSFVWIAIAAVSTTFNPKGMTSFLKITGLITGGTGILAVFGYLLNVPLLYYYVAGVNNAMAFHTAVLFVFLGFGFLCL